jgi:hypothetical protein
MSIDQLLSAIDAEIARLQQARALLAGTHTGTGGKRMTAAAAAPKKRVPKRVMSAEARKRIADAQRKRWAAQKKAAA